MKSICVYCGSSNGAKKIYCQSAHAMGKAIALRGLTLVYGGGNIGTMGALAQGALSEGGRVVGIMPQSLAQIVPQIPITELCIVKNMHERKAAMAARADAFVALPGGIGTFEELFEIWTWRYLGYHNKPIGLLDIDDYYSPLQTFLRKVCDEGFLKIEMLNDLLMEKDPERLLDALDKASSMAGAPIRKLAQYIAP